MNNINPIDLALATCLATFEALLWVINELLGFHAQATEQVTEQVKPQVQPEASEPALEAPTTAAKPALGAFTLSLTPDAIQGLREYYQQLTVKQLQAYTGIKSSRYNKARLVDSALTKSRRVRYAIEA